MFPNQVGGVKFDRFWNFLCRQIYVLTQTYATDAQRTIAFPCYAMNASAHACIFVGGVCAVVVTLYALIASFILEHPPMASAGFGGSGSQCDLAAGTRPCARPPPGGDGCMPIAD